MGRSIGCRVWCFVGRMRSMWDEYRAFCVGWGTLYRMLCVGWDVVSDVVCRMGNIVPDVGC